MHARRRLGFPRRAPPAAAVAASTTKPPPLLPATIRAAGSPPAIPPAATSRRSTCPSRIRAAWTNPRRSSLEARPAVGEPRSTSLFVARLQTRPRELLHIAMASSSMDTVNAKVKRPKANWDFAAHRVFIEVCKEEVAANNRPVQVLNRNGYDNLVQKFNERTKRNYDRKQMKNRWETLKKDYTIWKGLLLHASGLGRDVVTGTIDASDDWWAHEIQENTI